MKATFLFVNAECINSEKDSVYRISLFPVIENELQEPMLFDMNPHARFDWTVSGVEEDKILSFPDFETVWPQIESEFKKYDILMCSNNGYTFRAIHNTLKRLNIASDEFHYINTQSIIRKCFPGLVCYNLVYVCKEVHPELLMTIIEDETGLECWVELIIKSLSERTETSVIDFASNVNISLGKFGAEEFIPSQTIRDYRNRNRKVDFSDVTISDDNTNPFWNTTVVFTGKLESMIREDARKMVVSVGGNAPERLTKDTNYLVVGVQDLRVVGEKGLSGKMKKAEEYKKKGADIEIIDEKEFLEMITQKDSEE